jgi:hypothetical protein
MANRGSRHSLSMTIGERSRATTGRSSSSWPRRHRRISGFGSSTSRSGVSSTRFGERSICSSRPRNSYVPVGRSSSSGNPTSTYSSSMRSPGSNRYRSGIHDPVGDDDDSIAPPHRSPASEICRIIRIFSGRGGAFVVRLLDRRVAIGDLTNSIDIWSNCWLRAGEIVRILGVKYHGRGGPWLRRGLWREASGTTGSEFNSARACPCGDSRGTSNTQTHRECHRNRGRLLLPWGCVRGRPPSHVGATQARRRSKIGDFRDHERLRLSHDTASYPDVGARVLRGR